MWRFALHSQPGQSHNEIPCLVPGVREGYVCTWSEKLRIYFSAQQKKTPNNPLSSGQAQSVTNPFVLVWCSWSFLPFAGRLQNITGKWKNGNTELWKCRNKTELPFTKRWAPSANSGKSCSQPQNCISRQMNSSSWKKLPKSPQIPKTKLQDLSSAQISTTTSRLGSSLNALKPWCGNILRKTSTKAI